MLGDRSVVNFWSKDYGGSCKVTANVTIRSPRVGFRVVTKVLSFPLDKDGDGIADKWEIAMGARWSAQYGIAALTPQEAKDKFNNAFDDELADPDKDGTTEQGPLRAQAETGDAHSVKEEYRGYVLDGGGLNGAGAGGHAGGHIRLDPARKEILVEVDRAAVLNNVPGAGDDTNAKLKTILNGTSGVFSNSTRGAGIYMYWLMDDKELNIALEDVNTKVNEMIALSGARNSTLASDFIHVLLIDGGCLEAFGGNAIAYGRIDTDNLTRRGVVFATTDTTVTYRVADYPKREELFSSVLAHELTHMIIPDFTVSAGFDDNEHMFAPQADKTELMFNPRSKDNREFATVKIGPLAQKVFKIQSTEGISN